MTNDKSLYEISQELARFNVNLLGHVDKRDSHWGFDVIQAGICYGDQLAPKPDERRRVVAV